MLKISTQNVWTSDATWIGMKKIPSKEEYWYLWRNRCFFTHQNIKICLVLFAGQAGHRGVGQSGFRKSSILLIHNLAELFPFFFAPFKIFFAFHGTVCTLIITFTCIIMGLFFADKIVVFRLCNFFFWGTAGFCSPYTTFLIYVGILYRTLRMGETFEI